MTPVPRRTRSFGRPGTPVIPASWSAHHRPVVEATFGATVAVRRPGGIPGDFDPETGETPTVPHDPHYTGPARIQILTSDEQDQVAGAQEITTVGYRVIVEHDATVEPIDASVVGCLIDVTSMDDNGDPSLVDRVLTVQGIERGSLSWERDLIATDYLG